MTASACGGDGVSTRGLATAGGAAGADGLAGAGGLAAGGGLAMGTAGVGAVCVREAAGANGNLGNAQRGSRGAR